MSVVTNYLLLPGTLDESGENPAAWTALNERLHQLREGSFKRVDTFAGGRKVMEAEVYALAAHRLLPDEMSGLLRDLPWQYPEELRLVFRAQEQDDWTMVAPFQSSGGS